MNHHRKYGPRTAIVEKVLERAGRLTQQEVDDLAFAWNARGDTWIATNIVANAAYILGPEAGARADVWKAAYYATNDAGHSTACVVAIVVPDAALVALAADLVGQHGLTREHLETLAGPWRQVIGDVDPLEGIDDD